MRKMKNWLLLNLRLSSIPVVLAILIFHVAGAQSIAFEGIVLKAGTTEPIPYASIIFNTNRSTITNEEGRFVLIDSTRRVEAITISCIGFKTATSIVPKNVTTEAKFFLEESPVVLPEVAISDKEPDPVVLMKEVISLLESNFMHAPYESTFFYRGTIRENDKYTSFIESTGDWHSEGFNLQHYSEKEYNFLNFYEYFNPHHTRAALHAPWPQLENIKIARMPFLFSFYRAFRYAIPTTTTLYDLAFNKVYDEPSDLYVIDFKPKKIKVMQKQLEKVERNPGFSLSEGQYYIDYATMAITQIDFRFDTQGVTFSGTIKFTKIGDRYYKQYMRVTTVFSNNQSSYNTTEEVFWSDFDTRELSKSEIEKKYSIKLGDSKPTLRNLQASNTLVSKKLKNAYPGIRLSGLDWIIYSPSYEKNFWDRVVIPPNPHFKKIKNDLLTFGPLDQQFGTNKFLELYEKQKELNAHGNR